MSQPIDSSRGPAVVLERPAPGGGSRWLAFEAPEEIVEARDLSQVVPALRRLDELAGQGRVAAGFLTYEAAAAFDPAFRTLPPGPLPLLWFGVYREPRPIARPGGSGELLFDGWRPSVTPDDYATAVTHLRRRIERGDTYQVNYTFRLESAFSGEPRALFGELASSQPSQRRALLDFGDRVVCSASPELFFELADSRITTRPMKGTVRRGPTLAADAERAAWLRASEKNRAENLMIVDMMRNDLGRIARSGSVVTESLFDIERYESLFQMTSTVTAETRAPVSEILAALFPCASITGAPKVSAMRFIAALETAPRGIYTGAIGTIGPGRQAAFSVAIRTLLLDRRSRRAEYGTGGGIVWDSEPGEEYRECRAKALVVTARRPRFELLETLRWEPDSGYFLLARHVERLADSARYFGFSLDTARVATELAALAQNLPPAPRRVRLRVEADGEIHLDHATLPPETGPWRLAWAAEPVDPEDRFLHHKTTRREVYDNALAAAPGHDDVLLWNPDGEVTETCRANVVATIGGEDFTPPAECGLLAGVLRAELLATGALRERRLTRQELLAAEEVRLINSLRGWITVVLPAS